MNSSLPALLKVLADATRLRLLGLLGQEELSVGELARAVAMSQSRVSNHLKVLREAGMLDERREGAYVLVQLARGEGVPADLWAAIESRLAAVDGRSNDLARLEQVLDDRRRRSRDFFDRVAPEWEKSGTEFKRGSARWRALSALVPEGLVVADVGCGTGSMARTLVRAAERVICIDHSAAMLEQARVNLAPHLAQVEFRQGELDRLPLRDGEVDAIFASMVLHHVPDVLAALREMRRALTPAGRLVVMDLLPHKEAWMSEAMADLKLGLDATDLKSRAEKAGFEHVITDIVDDLYLVAGPTARPGDADGAGTSPGSGRKVELPMFLLHARAKVEAPNGSARSPAQTTKRDLEKDSEPTLVS